MVFLLDQIAALSRRYEVTVVANTRNRDFLNAMGIKANVFPVCIERRIAPISDIKALFSLLYLFKRENFAIIHSVTPKAGLLSMTAGFLAGVPSRVHTFTGQVWVTSSGMKRWFLKRMDKVLAALATNILVDSYSQREFLVEHGIVSNEKSRVLGKGSISGVDTDRFRPDPRARLKTRGRLGIRDDDIVLLYLGRLNRDKGVLDLAKAFSVVCAAHHGNLHLLVVGPDEENIRDSIITPYPNRVHFIEYTHEAERYIASADIFCLPSYREGFGSVIIEAASAGIPSVGSRIYGITDAIEEGVTGLLHDAGDVNQLAVRLRQLVDDPGLRRKMGENARLWAQRNFSKDMLTSAMLDYYTEILG